MTPSVAETLAALKAARKRIEDPERWTKGAFARRYDGAITTPRSADAVCWCAYGALRAEGGINLTIAWLYREFGRNPLVKFNDTHTHPEVLALFDRAIERIERLEANA